MAFHKDLIITENTPVKALPIEAGTIMEMLNMENKTIFVGSVEWIKDATVQVTDSSGAYLPPAEYNSPVKLRFFYGSQAITLSGVIRGTSLTFWRVDELTLLQAEERRQHFRQYTTLEGQVMCVNSLFGVDNGNEESKHGTFNCRVVDLSTTGARIRTDGAYEKGDMLFMVDVRISPYEPALTVTSIVRRVIEVDGVKEYGCEFYGLSNEEHEAITRLVLDIQRKALRMRRANQN